MLTSLVSLLTGRQVRDGIAMTGEITLRGNVLPIGGVKEKLTAAHRAGVKHVILPHENEKDIVDVPEKVLNDLQLTFVKKMSDVLDVALETEASLPPVTGPKNGKKSESDKDVVEDEVVVS